MGQTKIQSLIESATNVVVGYTVAVTSQVILFPVFGLYVTFRDNALLGLWFTVISVVRSFCVRRVFNKLHGAKL